ncbi:hypothetical protein [Bacillus cereus]|uniref:hypothetical protein n=1 Tax=Bacillus cereus TaxID=1396 RepID=UPI003204BF55
MRFFSLLGFRFTKLVVLEAKGFLDKLTSCVFVLYMALGIWTDHETSSAYDNKKGVVE